MAKVASLPLLDPETQIDRGGFGSIFPDPRNSTQCIKLFKDPILGDDAKMLGRLVDVARWARPSVAHTLTTRFAWPLELFGSEEQVNGYVMPLAPESAKFQLKTVGQTQTKYLQAMYLFDADYWNKPAVRSQPPALTAGDRIEILLDLHYALHILHQNGLVYGDISSKNVIIRMGEWPGVFLFDSDSISTVSKRAQSPLVTPGWETPETLGPLEIDRSRFALFVLRLLQEKLQAFPHDGNFADFEARFGGKIANSCASLFESGAAEDLDGLMRLLRSRRDPSRARAAISRAAESGFAKFVLREAEHAVTNEDYRLIQSAHNQSLYEEIVEGLAGAKRRQAAKRETLQRSGFTLDVSPTFSLAQPPGTEEELKDLVYQAMFVEIASHRASEGFDHLERHSWMKRAVEHALIEASPPEVSISAEVGKATIRIWWPPDRCVNSIMLRVQMNQVFDPLVFRRGDNDNQIIHVIEDPAGGNLRVEVASGSADPDGMIFWSPRKITSDTQIDPIPAPAVPVTAVAARQTPRPSLVTRIYDPEEERQRLLRERLEAEAQQREQRRKIVVRGASAIGALVLIIAAVLWFILPTGNQEVLGPLGETATPISGLELEVLGATVIARWDRPIGPEGERPVGYEIQWHSETQRGRLAEVVGTETFSSVRLTERTAAAFQVRAIFGDGSQGSWALTPVVTLGAHLIPSGGERPARTGIYGSPSILISDTGIATRFRSTPGIVDDPSVAYRLILLNGQGQTISTQTVEGPGLHYLAPLRSGAVKVDVQRSEIPSIFGPRASSRSVLLPANPQDVETN